MELERLCERVSIRPRLLYTVGWLIEGGPQPTLLSAGTHAKQRQRNGFFDRCKPVFERAAENVER